MNIMIIAPLLTSRNDDSPRIASAEGWRFVIGQ